MPDIAIYIGKFNRNFDLCINPSAKFSEAFATSTHVQKAAWEGQIKTVFYPRRIKYLGSIVL